MKKKFLFSSLIIAVTLFFVSCGNLANSLKEPYLKYGFYESESYINGVLIKIKKDSVENAKTLVLYYNDEEVKEFEDEIFIPSDPKNNYTTIEGYSVCAKNKNGLSDKETLYISSQGYILDKTYDVVLTQKSETYDSITFEWKLDLPDDLKLYDYEDSKMECLITDNHYSSELSEMKGKDIGENLVVLSNLEPASNYSSLYGSIIYSYTDLMGQQHKNIVTELNSQGDGYKGHTKALDKIESVSVTTKRTSAVITYSLLTEEQLHGLSDYYYLVRITNKDKAEEKPETIYISDDKATGNYTIKGLNPDTNYKFDIYVADSTSFEGFANMATTEGKTAPALPALNPLELIESDSDETDCITNIKVKFSKHPSDTAENPMEYQIEYYLFKTTSPKTASKEYFSYPTDGEITISELNAGNTYKFILKAREVNDTESLLSTEEKSIKTKETDNLKFLSSSSYLSKGNVYNWGIMTGDDVNNSNFFKINISNLYNYSYPKIMFINATTTSSMTFTSGTTKMGHFDVWFYNPKGENSNTKLKNVTSSSYLTKKTAEETASLCGTFIFDTNVYNDCIYLTPKMQYSSSYDNELTNDYKVAISFVAD